MVTHPVSHSVSTSKTDISAGGPVRNSASIPVLDNLERTFQSSYQAAADTIAPYTYPIIFIFRQGTAGMERLLGDSKFIWAEGGEVDCGPAPSHTPPGSRWVPDPFNGGWRLEQKQPSVPKQPDASTENPAPEPSQAYLDTIGGGAIIDVLENKPRGGWRYDPATGDAVRWWPVPKVHGSHEDYANPTPQAKPQATGPRDSGGDWHRIFGGKRGPQSSDPQPESAKLMADEGMHFDSGALALGLAGAAVALAKKYGSAVMSGLFAAGGSLAALIAIATPTRVWERLTEPVDYSS